MGDSGRCLCLRISPGTYGCDADFCNEHRKTKLTEEGMKFSKKLGQWGYFGAPIGDFNTEYAYRALVVIAGLGANTVEVALYPKTEQDVDGNPLTGEKTYILHFESYPQILEGGFWSVTAYGD